MTSAQTSFKGICKHCDHGNFALIEGSCPLCTLERTARSQAIDDATALANRWADDEEVLALEATSDEDMMFYKRCASRHRELAKFVEALKGST